MTFAITNVRKDFRFAIEINGVEQLLVQEVTMPDIELTEQVHGGGIGDADIKTPGKVKIGDMTLKKLKSSLGADDWVWPWMVETVALKDGFAKFAVLKELDDTGLKTLARYDLGMIWPKKISGATYKRAGDGDNTMEEITFSVSRYHKLPEAGGGAVSGGGNFA